MPKPRTDNTDAPGPRISKKRSRDMADIVVGIASSHTPQLSSGVDMWPDHALRDQRSPLLLGKDAEYHSYAETLASANPELARELAPEVWESKYQRAQSAISSLAAALAG